MSLRDFFKLGKWQPNLSRKPPPSNAWPDHILTLKSKNFEKFIDKYPLSMVDFWAPWCKPCGELAPRIRKLSKMYNGKVAFGRINVDDHKEISKRYHILGIPKLIFFSYGEKVTNIVGVKPIKDIQEKIEEILGKFEKK